MLADAPQTPPGLPPGSAPTQSPYGPPGFDSAAHTARPLLDPGVFDVSGPAGPGQNGGPLPTIVEAARALVQLYRRATWRAEAIRGLSARRVAERALRETRMALAAGLTADGVKEATSMIAATTDPEADPASVAYCVRTSGSLTTSRHACY